MVETITQKSEIYLGGTKFPIIGKVHRSKASGYPSKIVIGDYTFDDEPILSNWIISDQRGGILVEEMDESIHADRCWWSDLILSFKNSITLPRLVTEITKLDKLVDPTSSNDPDTDWTNDAQAFDNDATNYATSGAIAVTSWSKDLEFLHAGITNCRAIRFKCGGQNAAVNQIDLDAYYGSAWHDVYQGTFTHDTFTIKALSALQTVTKCRIKLYNSDVGSAYVAYIYEVDFIQLGTGRTPRCWANFNSELYVGVDDHLLKLNSTGDGLEVVANMVAPFEANITALISSRASSLYIFLGDADEYWYMSTAEAFTEAVGSDGAGGGDSAATRAIHWDSKLWGMDSAGQIRHAVTPNSATPTWTNNGSLADVGIADGEVNELFVYFDADGNQIIYAATQLGLFAHDYANAKFIETALALPQHTNSGKGAVVWHDAAFISSGLAVKKYIAGTTATISERGLDLDDGLPAKYQGEIVKLIKGDGEFFALVDSSQATGVNYSGVYAYDGIGWQCWWIAATADDTMLSGIISTAGPANTRRLYFDHDDKVYYIDIQRSIRKPKQISTFPYGAAGLHLSPNFDANTAHPKLAANFKIELKDITADETVVVSYRINHSTTNVGSVGTEWTLLATINAIELGAAYGEKEYTFASSVGLVFRSIQFRLDLVQGSTTTKSPEIIKAQLGFLKLLPIKWGFDVTVDCTKKYGGKTPAELIAALDALVELQTLSEFTYRDESGGSLTYYVDVPNSKVLEETGRTIEGIYQVALVEP